MRRWRGVIRTLVKVCRRIRVGEGGSCDNVAGSIFYFYVVSRAGGAVELKDVGKGTLVVCGSSCVEGVVVDGGYMYKVGSIMGKIGAGNNYRVCRGVIGFIGDDGWVGILNVCCR